MHGESVQQLEVKEKNPDIIPGDDHISTLQHQGRHFTEGAVRGLRIVEGRRLLSKVLISM